MTVASVRQSERLDKVLRMPPPGSYVWSKKYHRSGAPMEIGERSRVHQRSCWLTTNDPCHRTHDIDKQTNDACGRMNEGQPVRI
jgi:hypothetical protein